MASGTPESAHHYAQETPAPGTELLSPHTTLRTDVPTITSFGQDSDDGLGSPAFHPAPFSTQVHAPDRRLKSEQQRLLEEERRELAKLELTISSAFNRMIADK